MIPRKEVIWFSGEMEKKLKANDHKGGWQGCRVDELFPRINEERDELLLLLGPRELDTINENITPEQAKEIIGECADIANFAMMVADVVRLISRKLEAKK